MTKLKPFRSPLIKIWKLSMRNFHDCRKVSDPLQVLIYRHCYQQGIGKRSTAMLGSGSLLSSGGGGSLSQSLSSFNKSLRSVISQGTTQQQIFADVGYFRGAMLAIKKIHKEHIQLTRSVLLEFSEVRELVKNGYM